jgi:SAM-dependent methyltransferase
VTTSSREDIDQHNKEIHENLGYWNRKPALRDVYSDFYRTIAAQLRGCPDGPIVECGSGIGNLKSVIPHAIATDLFPNPWLDRTENVYRLSFADESLAAVILFDVFHHLEFPGEALREIRRVLLPEGRLVIFEPGMGLLGRVILGTAHHEPLAMRQAIRWLPPPDWDPLNSTYYAAQGNSWRIFVRREFNREIERDWNVASVEPMVALRWLLTGGFRGPLLLRKWMIPLVRLLESMLGLMPKTFASRLLVVLEKRAAK